MKTVIFDFDGTIADSFDYVADFLTSEAGLAPMNDGQKLALRGLSMAAMARHLGYGWWRLPRLFVKGRHRMGRAIEKLQPFEDMTGIIKELNTEGYKLFMVSNNSTGNLQLFLRHNKLSKYFSKIYGGVGLFGKAPVLRRLLKEHGLDKQNVIYIGDELRDIEAAQSVGIRVVAVRWGFARSADLLALKPTAVADTPGELMAIINRLSKQS
ncbi:MAG TPA: HAD-IA family hydrolase [Candidatus Saccharimonadales bacterium]|nr:HAD-IA family hydrolase [Candidatus Saccharimonadales bacterium]